MIIAATGHRPDKLGGYGRNIEIRLKSLALTYLLEWKHGQIKSVISGMALGWDIAVALAAIKAKIPLIAAVPFKGQELKWPKPSQMRYWDILAQAERTEIVCDGDYAIWKLHKRNEWMVDHCTRMMALWDGSDGGTKNCLAYATKQKRPYDNLWHKWQNEKA